MTKPVAWSYSRLTSFETCPKRFYHLNVAKDVKDSETEATTWGHTVHKALEEYLRDGKAMSPATVTYKPLADKLADKPGTLLVEQKLTINRQLQPTDWFAKDAWCRGIVDAGVLAGKRAVLLDWKTGKRKPDSDQMKLFAALAFTHYEVNTVTTGFVWLKDNKVDKEKFERERVGEIWMHFLPRVQRYEKAHETGSFPPKPSGLCQKWCPVPNNKCQFSGKR